MKNNNLTVTTVWSHPTLPMQLQRFSFDVDMLPIENARRELEAYIASRSDGKSKTWGYFPETNPDTSEYPATLQLVDAFETSILAGVPQLHDLPLKLAFVRRATDEPVSQFGGFHVDANAGISHVWPEDVDSNQEVFRLLFNLCEVPRTLQFYPYTLEQLREQGIDIPRDHYEMLDNLPDALEIAAVDILPKEDNAIYGLSFISTQIPHAGHTTNAGHFLITYGAYISPDQVEELFQK
jgi:hypothetical protein